MGMADTCRVCVSGRRRLHAISNTLFQEIWEKLTNAKFITNDGKSLHVCYMCCAQLRRAHQLMKRASEAEKLLTAIVNNGSEQSQNALLLTASQTFDHDYKYSIQHQYLLDCDQFLRNTVEEVKKENEGEIEEDNEEHRVINIKEEKEDSSQEDDLDANDVDSNTPWEDDTLLKQILEREVRIVLEKIDMGPSIGKHKLNAKLIKLDETTKNRISTNTALTSLPKKYCKTSYKTKTKKSSVDKKVKISKNKQNTKSVVNCHQGNKNSPKVNTLPKLKVRANKVITHNNDTLTSKVCNNSVNDISKQCVPKSSDTVAPSTSLDGSDEGKQTIICNLRKGLENEFSCDMCRYKCVTKSVLNRHLRAHTVEKPFICDLCDYRCSGRDLLKSHIMFKHIKEKNFSCDMCQYKCVTKTQLNGHLRVHTGEKPYVCDLCDYRFSQRTALVTHIKHKHTKEKKFSCQMCQYKSVTKGMLDRHLLKHTGEKPYVCDFCDYRCSQRYSLVAHVKYKHTKEKKFSCHICQYKCVIKYQLTVHLRKHTGEKPYICGLCDNRFSQHSNLERHIKCYHMKETKFSCDKCQFSCFTKCKLKSHFRIHTGEKPYKCDLCDDRFSLKGNLKRHIEYKHIKIMKFSCHMCQYKCVRKSDLNLHLRKHSEEKPYTCDLCDYRCSIKAYLINHIKFKHTKEKNFSCHMCQYKSVTKSKLVLHLRKHTGEKPYKCEMCNYKCSISGNLTKHIRSQHAK